jgi:hypothetical protein
MEPSDELRQAALNADLDLIVDRDPWQIFRDLAGAIPDLRLLVTSHYDVGGYSLWATDTTARPMQLDLLFDPAGTGRLGIITSEFLPAIGVSTMDDMSEETCATYFLMKGCWKGQVDRVSQAAENLRRLSSSELRSHLRKVLHPRFNAYAYGVVEESYSRSLPTIDRFQYGRLWERFRNPTGQVVTVADANRQQLTSIAASLNPLVRRVHVIDNWVHAWRRPILRRKPDVIITTGSGAGSLSYAGVGDPESFLRLVTDLLDSRVRGTLGSG